MAHEEQAQYCLKIKDKFPHFFKNKRVLDIGSLDINGNNRFLFENCQYTGIDVGFGKNVNIVCKGHEFDMPDRSYDVIISTECFEHDMYYQLTIKNVIRMLKPGGLFMFTCATTGRPEHGTRRSSPISSPLTQQVNELEWGDYYKNLTEQDIRDIFNPEQIFSDFEFETRTEGMCDLYFYGVKK